MSRLIAEIEGLQGEMVRVFEIDAMNVVIESTSHQTGAFVRANVGFAGGEELRRFAQLILGEVVSDGSSMDHIR